NGRAQEISILADATSQGVTMVAQALSRPGGSMAMRMRIVEQFVQELGRIVKTSNVSVVPAELAKIESTFRGIGRVSETMAGQAGQRDRS
ncbi:MAG: band-7 C-terminal domain-containing protein, partial [Myxococcota bacterium]